MSVREKVTSGFAWAGLVIVIAVPTVEAVKSKLMPDNDIAVASAVEPVQEAAPAAPAAEAASAPEPVAATAPKASPAPAVKQVAATAPAEEVAASTPKASALQQYLATGKKLPDYVTPNAPAQPAAAPAAAEAPKPAAAAQPAPAATDAEAVASTAPAQPPKPMPSAARPKSPPARVVTDADLKDWKSGSLEEFLKQRGLLTPAN